jgi:ribosome-binding protein aMBF1 (putative translation factor)
MHRGKPPENRTLLVLDAIGCATDDAPVEAKLVVGRNIREHRRRLGVTQETLAHRAGMHPVEVGRAERGTRDLRVSTVAKLARGLEVEACELLRGIS